MPSRSRMKPAFVFLAVFAASLSPRFAVARPGSGEPVLVSSDSRGVVVEISGSGYQADRLVLDSGLFDRIGLPGAVWLPEPGRPAVPVRGVLIGVPFGADLSLEVLDVAYEEIPDVNLMPVPETRTSGREDFQRIQERYEPDDRFYAEDRFYPGDDAAIGLTGVLRDQRVAAISLRPLHYNPVRKVLRVAKRLRVRVGFSAEGRFGVSRPAVRVGDDVFESIYRKALLNADEARDWRSRAGAATGLRKLQPGWYDPAASYTKLTVSRDGIYRLDADWFANSEIDLSAVDLTTLKIYLNGEEIPLEVRGGEDGSLDEGDGIYFYGRFRRTEHRDFESPFGRNQIYWLTFDGGHGKRMVPTDATPVSDFPLSPWFISAVHAEVDSVYEALGLAEDAERDHWYWRGVTSAASGLNAAALPTTVEIALPGLEKGADIPGRMRVGMHGLTSVRDIEQDHRTTIEVNEGGVLADDRWDGQTAFIASGEVPASALSDTTLVTVSAPGSLDFPDTYRDELLLNWVRVSYPRRYEAESGRLHFEPDNASGATLSIEGFQTASVTVYDLGRGRVLEGLEVAAEGSGFRVRFELADAEGRFIAADTGAILRPEPGRADTPSDLRGERAGGAYVVITHAAFREGADALAAHRAADGFEAMVVDVEDIYDEFSFGQLDPEAIQRFMAHAFDTWTTRPGYLLLLGRASYDYRDLFGESRSGRRNFVPALPFQTATRGVAYTDHMYGAVAGEDPFQDLFVGRFSIDREREVETIVGKVVAYDALPLDRWRDRILYMANADIFSTGPSDALAEQITEPFGLETFRVYNEDQTPEPNDDTRRVIEQINEGRLVVNFAGHGSFAIMAFFLRGTFQQGNYNYMARIKNGERLPLVVAMSCLNGLFANPRRVSLSEEMVNKTDGGAIAYVSASTLAFLFTNRFINNAMFRRLFEDGIPQIGRSLALAKIDMLTAFPGLVSSAQGMHLMGDPAQALALLPTPDYTFPEVAVNVERKAKLIDGDSTRVSMTIENRGIPSQEGLDLVILDRHLGRGKLDTLFMATVPPFGQRDSVATIWRLGGRAGSHRLEIQLDPDDRIAEWNEMNNRLELDLEVFGGLTAIPTTPLESQVVPASNVQLVVRPEGEIETGEVLGEFEVDRTPAFEGADVVRSGPVASEAGKALWVWQPIGLQTGVHHWRARLTDGEDRGAWTAPQPFVVTSEVPPPTEVVWRQEAREALTSGSGQDVERYIDGSVGRVLQPPPMRVEGRTREAAFSAEGVTGTAVLCTDGRFLYVKRFNPSDDLYPGSDLFQQIGTGLSGTVAGQNYGTLSETPVIGISATYHSDGFIYADDGAARELVRISPLTGAADRVKVPEGLLNVENGLVFDGHSLITSDGNLIYNIAWGVDGIRRAGWSVRVFDPDETWRLVREFVVKPTSTGFTYLFTDGILADGRYLYLIEFGTGLTHRVRVVDATDGQFVTEFESDQAETDILGGQYDWQNNQVWLGQLNGPAIYRYTGRKLPEAGRLTSSPIGPAGTWNSLDFSIQGASRVGARAELDILGEETLGRFVPTPNGSGLSPGSTIDLSRLDPSFRRIRLRLYLSAEGVNRSPGLTAWSVRFQPLPNLKLSDLRIDPLSVEELRPVTLRVDVLNRGPLNRVLGAAVAFYRGPPRQGRIIGRAPVPAETPLGASRNVSFTWQTGGFAGRHVVHARVEDLLGRPSFYAEEVSAPQEVEIVPSGDREAPRLEVAALDVAGEVRPDDFLPVRPRFQVSMTDSSGIDPETVEIKLAGETQEHSEGISSSAVSDVVERSTSLHFVYGPTLDDDRYSLQISATDRLGNGPASKALSFRVSSELRIERVLNVPNPMVEDTDFTFLLSRGAEVTIRIYTVSGRLVRILEGLSGTVGFNQTHWNGRDRDGNRLANGVYLYTVTARDGSESARVKERLIVYR